MRLIWVIGTETPAYADFAKALNANRSGVEYVVRFANAVSDIPDEHLAEPGVVALLDAFHPSVQGFAGLRALRDHGFKGPAFLMGEPAPESISDPFLHQNLNGCFAPLERADFAFMAGFIHHHLTFAGNVELNQFLAPGGRCASERITSLKEFNLFGNKLATFVGRFGINLDQLRKTLMGMSLAHVKAGAGSAMIEEPFVIHYGMDPKKLVLSITTYSRGAGRPEILSEYARSITNLKTPAVANSTMFPEFHHVVKATGNLMVMSGSAKVLQENVDPLYMLTVLPFPKKNVAPVNSFGFSFVMPTDDLTEDFVKIEKHQKSAPAAVKAPEPEAAPAHAAGHEEPEGVLSAPDLDKLLKDPVVVGDAPAGYSGDMGDYEGSSGQELTPQAGESMVLDNAGDTEAVSMSAAKLKASSEELTRLRQENAELDRSCKAMGEDLRRLMKERRVPTTDRELRDELSLLNEKLKKKDADLAKQTELVTKRTQEVEALKTQLEAARKELDTFKRVKSAA